MAETRQLYPGGNTCYGFYSFYDQIIPPDARRIMIIKGGPGVGKSSFMRSIAEEMGQRGFDAELLQCSSDNGSLDGVVFPQIQVAMIDGTAPHIVDPKNPGCVDEIIHLGDFWHEEGMLRGKEAVLTLNQEVGRLFARAYRFLRAAKEIREAQVQLSQAGFDAGRANILAEMLIEEFLGGKPVALTPGGSRRLFASAITPMGPDNHLETVFGRAKKLTVIKGRPGSGRSTLLGKVARAAVERGLAAEEYYCGFDPQRLEHLLLPETGIGFITVNEYHHFGEESADRTVEMDGCLAREVLLGYERAAEDGRRLFDELLDRAVACIKLAKETHDRMEQYYIPNMDFAAIDRLRGEILARILRYAETAKVKAM